VLVDKFGVPSPRRGDTVRLLPRPGNLILTSTKVGE
jgi:hypothetical protein